jgi:hypothetical protein
MGNQQSLLQSAFQGRLSRSQEIDNVVSMIWLMILSDMSNFRGIWKDSG